MKKTRKSLMLFLFPLLLSGCSLKTQEPISKTGIYFDTVIQIDIYDSNDTKLLNGIEDAIYLQSIKATEAEYIVESVETIYISQEYIDEMENLTDNIDRLIDGRSRMSDDMEQLNVQDVFNSFGAMLGEDFSTYADLLKIDNEHNLDGVSIFTHLNDKYSEYIKEKEARKKARQ